MPKGQRIKPEQIVMLLRQVEVLTANGKTLAQACKEIGLSAIRHMKAENNSWCCVGGLG